jgi:hypothetical protein
MFDWWLFVFLIGAVPFGLFFLFRSFGRWKSPPPTTPEAKQAEARLWSTRVMDQL